MNELNKKLAEWAGFTYSPETNIWVYPSGIECLELPNFPQSLDACFKWLMPKYIKTIMEQKGLTYGYAYWLMWEKWWQELVNNDYSRKDIEPALALCLAIERLIDEEK